jgi:hypothetical protein
MESNVAELLEQQILSNRAVFPCGCVLECKIHYPHKDWVYTGRSIHICAEHPPKWAFVVGDFGAGEYRVSVPHFVGKFGKPYLVPEQPTDGPLERKWLKPDGTQLTLAELEQAMEENLDRLDDEARSAVERTFREARHISQDHTMSPPPQFGRISRTDPHIVSQEGVHAIGRYGSVAAIPGRHLIQSMDHDHVELLIEKPSYRPGDWIDLPKLQKMYNERKFLGFGLSYGISTVLPSVQSLSMATATLAQFNAKWSAAAAAVKGFETKFSVLKTRTPSARLPDYAELDARRLLMGLELLSKDNLPARHDTLPSTPSPPDRQEEKKGKE